MRQVDNKYHLSLEQKGCIDRLGWCIVIKADKSALDQNLRRTFDQFYLQICVTNVRCELLVHIHTSICHMYITFDIWIHTFIFSLYGQYLNRKDLFTNQISLYII